MTPADKYKDFALSPWHAWTALLTMGPGLASAHPFYMALSAAAYACAWVFLPDTALFRRWRERRRAELRVADESAAAAEWQRKLAVYHAPLSTARKAEYEEVVGIARDIDRLVAELGAEGHGLDADQSLRQVDSLVWTFLRLLKVEQDQRLHLDNERRDNLPEELEQAQTELRELEAALPRLESSALDKSASARIRIAASQRERIQVLKHRLAKLTESEAGVDLVRVEKARILDLFKLLRADLQSSRDLHGFSRRIDDSRRAWTLSQDSLQGLEFLREDPALEPPPPGRRFQFTRAEAARGKTRA